MIRVIYCVVLLFVCACTSSPKKNIATETLKQIQADSNTDSVGNANKSRVTRENIKSAGPTSLDTAKLFLKDYFKIDISKQLLTQGSRKFLFDVYDLNNDGKREYFIGLIGPYFCGSGGCTCLLLNAKYQIINRFTVTNFPITILENKPGKWANLVIESSGKHHLLKYDGVKYPSNPSMQQTIVGKSSDSLKTVLNNLKVNSF
ncbi:hypothetical protein IDJ77_02335 [Mucilaginibacter sp. ZT4R22]|uniref:Lipoprotein n=1 Tax=Mucilaginibacter pankratovii TaxID=2772110 RepID=A0ABR7WJY7_9SPHI|nr:hypothetical protein [Mucilaginibacter pankratovii]MBD1362636.1 hypothetical protein [Mucilaginibacter pankratovii]